MQTFTFPPGAFVSGQTFAELTHVYAAKGKYDLTLVWRDQHGAYNFADDLEVHVLPAKKK